VTKNIGRNDPCPCGSGKKYKSCHLNAAAAPSWREVAEGVPLDHPQKQEIIQTFSAMNDDFRVRPIAGGCHMLSGIMHVLLAEQGVDSDLCIGEVRHPSGPAFDHSWVEIDGKVFDVAIQQTDNGERHAPVFAGADMDTGKPSKFNYRYRSVGLGSTGRMAYETPFVTYMDGAPKAFGKWGGIEAIAKRSDLAVNVDELRAKYQGVQRRLMQP
jgi:hypothetical protein